MLLVRLLVGFGCFLNHGRWRSNSLSGNPNAPISDRKTNTFSRNVKYELVW